MEVGKVIYNQVVYNLPLTSCCCCCSCAAAGSDNVDEANMDSSKNILEI